MRRSFCLTAKVFLSGCINRWLLFTEILREKGSGLNYNLFKAVFLNRGTFFNKIKPHFLITVLEKQHFCVLMRWSTEPDAQKHLEARSCTAVAAPRVLVWHWLGLFQGPAGRAWALWAGHVCQCRDLHLGLRPAGVPQVAVQFLVPFVWCLCVALHCGFLGFGGGLIDLPAFYCSLTLDLGFQEG